MNRARSWSARDGGLLVLALVAGLGLAAVSVGVATNTGSKASAARKLLAAPAVATYPLSAVCPPWLGSVLMFAASFLAWGSGAVALASLGMRWRRRRLLFYVALIPFLAAWLLITWRLSAPWDID